ncbi:alpha/beta hydrolase [Candidatus Microgenomates bacterium]|nr:alpha/beta hydrolase [Candidatus Microgenomates bacterium]
MTFSYQGKTIAYDVMGKGSPLLMVHGWGGSRESLRRLGELLSGKHKIILVDLPGFGQSDTPPPEWGTPQYAEVLIGLLDELHIKNADYFGHSFGGSLGLYLSVHSKRIDHLVLCNSSYKRSGKVSPFSRIAKHIIPGNNSPLKMILYRIFFRASDLARYPQVASNHRLIMKQDLSPIVPDVKVPTLILWGAIDTITPLSLGRELHEKIKDSQLVIIPDARHGLPLRQPELLVEPIEKFL